MLPSARTLDGHDQSSTHIGLSQPTEGEIPNAGACQRHDRFADKCVLFDSEVYASSRSHLLALVIHPFVLSAVGVEYPKKHGVGRVLLRAKESFTARFTVDEFARTSLISASKS